MGRSFYVSGFKTQDKDRWVVDEAEFRAKGDEARHPGVSELKAERRAIMDPRTGEQAVNPLTGKARWRTTKRDASLGFDSTEVHYAGDRVVKVAEEVEILGGKPTGDILYRFERIGDDGRSQGTYVQRWAKDGEGRHVSTGKAKRYFT